MTTPLRHFVRLPRNCSRIQPSLISQLQTQWSKNLRFQMTSYNRLSNLYFAGSLTYLFSYLVICLLACLLTYLLDSHRYVGACVVRMYVCNGDAGAFWRIIWERKAPAASRLAEILILGRFSKLGHYRCPLVMGSNSIPTRGRALLRSSPRETSVLNVRQLYNVY